MTVAKAQVILPFKTGLPEDVVVNTWSFNAAGVDLSGVDALSIADALVTFYGAIDVFLSNALSAVANAAQVRVYDVTSSGPGAEDDVLGSPDLVLPFTLTTAANGLPAEVAACLSFNGVLTDIPEEDGITRPASRRRGRVYLGPIASGATDTDSSGRVLIAPAFITAALDAVVAMHDSLEAELTPIMHSVYSPTENVSFNVVRYFMDNAFDTMRGRGVKRTTRAERTV